MKFKLNPIRECALVLILMALLSSFFKQDFLTIGIHALLTIGGSLVLGWLVSKLFKKQRLWEDRLITGLILFLLLHPGTTTPWMLALIAVAIAMLSKNLITIKGMPVFNPSVAGLLGLLLITKLIPTWNDPFISWWGADFKGIVSLVIIVGWMLWGLKKWRKFWILGSFLIMHAVLLGIQGALERDWSFWIFTFTHSTVYFMASIMLIEPKTSPFLKNQQIVYGIVTAVAMNGFLMTEIPYVELLSIASVNAMNGIIKMASK